MTTAALRRAQPVFGPEANGILMTPAEFDRAEFEDGWRYELINGVLIVSPIPAEKRWTQTKNWVIGCGRTKKAIRRDTISI